MPTSGWSELPARAVYTETGSFENTHTKLFCMDRLGTLKRMQYLCQAWGGAAPSCTTC